MWGDCQVFLTTWRRDKALDKAIEVCTSEAKAKKLKDARRTRWVYCIDSYVVFLELLPAVHTVLDAIVLIKN